VIRLEKNKEAVDKEIVIKFHIRNFYELYDMDKDGEPIGESVYNIDDFIEQIRDIIEDHVFGDLIEYLDDSIPEEYQYIDDLVDMDVFINGKKAELFKRKKDSETK
jgi:hypothetical protein